MITECHDTPTRQCRSALNFILSLDIKSTFDITIKILIYSIYTLKLTFHYYCYYYLFIFHYSSRRCKIIRKISLNEKKYLYIKLCTIYIGL